MQVVKQNTASRRTLLQGAVAVGACLSVPLLSAAGAQAPISPLALIDETLARLLVGSDFVFSMGGTDTVMQLVRVQSTAQSVRKGGETMTRSFGLEFLPLDGVTARPQGTYWVRHARLGDFDLFVVPHRNDKGQTKLLATFSAM